MHQAKSQFIAGKPVRVPKALREDIEAAIHAHLTAVEKLTAVLDKAEGDPELEPSLGWRMGYGGDWSLGATDDREDEHDGREPDVDREPSLGSLIGRDGGMGSQLGWANGDTNDLEQGS